MDLVRLQLWDSALLEMMKSRILSQNNSLRLFPKSVFKDKSTVKFNGRMRRLSIRVKLSKSNKKLKRLEKWNV